MKREQPECDTCRYRRVADSVLVLLWRLRDSPDEAERARLLADGVRAAERLR